MKVVILCGGRGTRFNQQTESKPKPMIEIGNRPIIWHIMKTYSQYGFNEFILCCGYKSEVIKRYFLNYRNETEDFTIDLQSKKVTYFKDKQPEDWKVHIIDTGLDNNTGSRIKQIESLITEDHFLLTYGDGVTDLNISKLVDFHKSHNSIGTVTGVSPPSQYGVLKISRNDLITFQEKPQETEQYISGGYFVFNKEFFSYLSLDPNCMLEKRPLENLSKENQLKVYKHDGFWQCMDTSRDYGFLNEEWAKDPKWKVW